jgi:hypothetical protein
MRQNCEETLPKKNMKNFARKKKKYRKFCGKIFAEPRLGAAPRAGKLAVARRRLPDEEVVVARHYRTVQGGRRGPVPPLPAWSSPCPDPASAGCHRAGCLPAGPPPPPPADLLHHGSWEGARWESREVNGERTTEC